MVEPERVRGAGRFPAVRVLLLMASVASTSPVNGEEPKGPRSQETGTDLTVYNQNFTVVKERRLLDFEQGVSDIRFPDVAATIIPESVRFQALRPASATVLEQNYEFDLVSANKLLDKYIDRDISIIGRDGSVTDGKLLSSDKTQIVLSNDSGIQLIPRANNIKDIRFSSLPEGLLTRPTLVWKVKSQEAGEHLVNVAYHAQGVDWRVDYRMVVTPDETAVDLHGWVTVVNRSGTSFRDANLKLMAGDVNVAVDKGNRVGKLVAPRGKKGGIDHKSFSDYHLYSLPHPTTLANAQTKQVELMAVEGIPVSKSYLYRSSFGTRVAVRLAFDNSKKTSNGLGIPLPQGPIRLYLTDGDGEQEFLGSNQLGHTPKNERVRIQSGFAFDIVADRQLMANRERAGVKWNEQDLAITFRNHKEQAIQLHVEELLARNRNWKLRNVSHEHKQLNANTITFDLKVPANGQVIVTYTAEYTW